MRYGVLANLTEKAAQSSVSSFHLYFLKTRIFASPGNMTRWARPDTDRPATNEHTGDNIAGKP
jgi:hypothetical protein